MKCSVFWKLLDTLLILGLHIMLPTFDVYSDLAVIIRFYNKGGHYGWAALLAIPFVLNYLLNLRLWWRLDKMKHISWIAVLLGCYLQFYALNVIRLLWVDLDLGIKKKRKMERNFSEFGVFESVFTVLVMTYILFRVHGDEDNKEGLGFDKNLVFKNEFIQFHETNLLVFSYLMSILTGSFGLARVLKSGPCRVLGEGGALGGILSSRFLLLVMSVGSTFISKFMLPWTIVAPYSNVPYSNVTDSNVTDSNVTDRYVPDSNVPDNNAPDSNVLVLGFVGTMICAFLPGLLVAFLSLCRFREIFKILVSHPSLMLMPVFTHYTFTVNIKNLGDPFIIFSRRWTLFNIAVSPLGHIILGYLMLKDPAVLDDRYKFNVLPIAILGMLLTLLFIALDQCCVSCPCSPDLQVSVLKFNDPLTDYVVDKDDQEIVAMEEWKKKDKDDQEIVAMEEWRKKDKDTIPAQETISRTELHLQKNTNTRRRSVFSG